MVQDNGFGAVASGDEATLMVNNLGATPGIELYLLANAALRYLTSAKQASWAATQHLGLRGMMCTCVHACVRANTCKCVCATGREGIRPAARHGLSWLFSAAC